MLTREAIVSDTATYKPEAIRALRAFKALKTFKPENADQRLPGLQALVNALKTAYEMNVDIPVVEGFLEYPEFTDSDVLIMPIYLKEGNFSIITLLNRFARIRSQVTDSIVGINFVARQKWAVNLFRKVYPRQFARLFFNPADGGFYTEMPVTQDAEQPAGETLTEVFERVLATVPAEANYTEDEESDESFEM